MDGNLPRRSQPAIEKPALQGGIPITNRSSSGPSQSEFRHLRLGIETEFLLAARNPHHDRPRLDHFAEVLAANHNAYVGRQYPRMNSTLLAPNDPDDNTKWSMVYESTNWRDRSPCKAL